MTTYALRIMVHTVPAKPARPSPVQAGAALERGRGAQGQRPSPQARQGAGAKADLPRHCSSMNTKTETVTMIHPPTLHPLH